MRTFARPCVTLFVVIAVLVAASGCATPASLPPAAPATERVAQVELVNLSDCDWRVAVALPDGRVTRALLLPARETSRVELPGGDYEITQTALSGIAGANATRHFPARLDSGESYRWRLATLLAAPTGNAP